MRSPILRLIVLIVLLYMLYLWYFPNGLNFETAEPDKVYYLAKLRANYAEEIEEICTARKLPAAYFKALAILECSAEKPPQSRYEPKVHERLREVKAGKKPRYGNLKHLQLRELSDETLQEMATSWGVFQLMGYHAYDIGIAPRDLQGADALRQAIIWIDKAYGTYLRKGDFANALHIHNVGKPIPAIGSYETHDAQYIPRGLNFIRIFQEEQMKKDAEKAQKPDSMPQQVEKK
jgi:hypothetical protein